MLRMAPGGATDVGGVGSVITTTDNPFLTFRIDRVLHLVGPFAVGVGVVFIRAIFHDIAQHILQAERIRLDARGLLCPVAAILGVNHE